MAEVSIEQIYILTLSGKHDTNGATRTLKHLLQSFLRGHCLPISTHSLVHIS